MQSFTNAVNRLSQALAVVASVMLSAAVLVLCYMVARRYFGYSSYWEIEVSIYLTVGATFLASPFTLQTGGHVAVDLWTRLLPGRAQRMGQIALALCGMAVCLYLAWIGLELTLDAFATGERTNSMWKPPRWPMFATMPIGLGLTAVQYVCQIAALAAPDTAGEPVRHAGREQPGVLS
ncbi:MAG TPA: TRAP transporter small permease [Azospirillum sp.]|nr:TRAP transporter small permease [Azospirillum sp.]